jgi:hypothetical protein
LITLTIVVGLRGFGVGGAKSMLASCFCSSSTIRSKLGNGLSNPVKKSEVLTNLAMSKVNTGEKLSPSVITNCPGPTSTD